jgi:hypothetical protein
MAFGFGKKWKKRVSGLSAAQARASRRIGIPLSGRKSCSRRIFTFLLLALLIAFAWRFF